VRRHPSAAGVLVVAATAVLGFAGCGDSGSGSSSTTTSAKATTADEKSQEVTALGATFAAVEEGVEVVSVQEPKVRLQAGDVITAVNGTPVRTPQELASEAGDLQLSESARLAVKRGSHSFALDIVSEPTSFLGVEVKDTTAGPAGAVVVTVVKGSPAEAAGLQAGDVIRAIDGTRVKSGSAVTTQVARNTPGDKVTITLVRGSDEMDVTATLAANPHGEE
jgi:S1-C subfamily serine protease